MSRFLIAAGGTGGHLAPGIAVAAALRARGHEALVLVSRKPVDARLAAAYPDLRFAAMPGAGLGWSPPALLRFVVAQTRAFAFCREVLRRDRPDVFLGFGGFTSAPGLIVSRLRGVPCALHEANRVPGRAVRLLGRFARRVYLPPGVTLPGLRPGVARAAGLPVRRGIEPLPAEPARAALGFDPGRPLLAVLGGSQGAAALNAWAREHRPALAAAGLQLCVVTGPGRDDPAPAGPASGPRAVFLPFCDRMAELLSAADLLVSRAGAGTLAELVRCRTPAVLVPYPQAADQHQAANAAHFVSLGGGEVVAQADLDRLLPRVLALLAAPAALAEHRRRLAAADAAAPWEDLLPDLERLAGAAAPPASRPLSAPAGAAAP